MSAQIPRPDSRLFLDPKTGLPHRTWYRYWESTGQSTALVSSLASGKIWIGSATALPAAQTMSGDATLSVAGVLTIANDAVSFAKMQNIVTDSLIGRDTASTGDPETILLNATLSMDGAGNLQRAALSGDLSASAGSNTTTLATVNANVGTFGSATAVSQVTVNGKGLTTAAADVAIAIPSTQVTDFTEAAQDAAGAMVDTTLVYVDATPLLTRAALTGEVTASQGSNSTTVAASHSGSTHAAVQAAAEATAAAALTAHEGAADPHTSYRLESADHTHQNTGAQAGQLDHGLALTGLTDDDHTQYLLASAATDRATFAANWTDLTDGGGTTLHTHAATGVTNFHALIAAHVDVGI